jgi:hypothetical protein
VAINVSFSIAGKGRGKTGCVVNKVSFNMAGKGCGYKNAWLKRGGVNKVSFIMTGKMRDHKSQFQHDWKRA